jgi:hypothetical protein
MQKGNSIRKDIMAVVFVLTGLFFLGAGLWNVAASLAADFFVTSAVVTLLFLLLFAVVAITYGLFLFRSVRQDTDRRAGRSIFDRVNPGTVVGLLAFGLAPLLFVHLSGESRELNTRRQAAFFEIRPAFLQYLADHGKVPGDLHLLVPEYMPALPEAVMSQPDSDPDRWVRYQPGENTAFFFYKTGGIPAAQTCYDIVNNQFRPPR